MVIEELLRSEEPAIRSYGVWKYLNKKEEVGMASLFEPSQHFLCKDVFYWNQQEYEVSEAVLK